MTPSRRPSLATASGVPPALAISSEIAWISRAASEGAAAAAHEPCCPTPLCGCRRHQRRSPGSHRPRPCGPTSAGIDAAHAGLRGERNEGGGELRHVAAADAVFLLGEHDDRAAFRRLVGQRGELRRIGQFLLGHAADRAKRGRLPVAERDGAGLVEQQRVDVAGGLDRAARHRQHVEAHQPVHAGDADRRQQRADGGRDQRDEQRHQDDDRDRAAGIGGVARDGHGREHEDDGQAGEQDVERDLVRRLLPLGALDQLDHAVDEGRALRRGDAHADPVGQHLGAAGDRRAVAAGFADHGRGFAGDRGLVDRGDALDHLAVGRDVVAGLDQHDIADLEAGAGDEAIGLVGAGQQLGLALGAGLAAATSACALPRPSATASAKLANSTVNHSQRMIWKVKPRLLAAGHQIAQEDHGGQRGHDLDHEHHRVLDHHPRIELDEGRADRRQHDLRIEQRRDRHPLVQFLHDFHGRNSELSSIRTGCRRSSRGARRSGRAPAPGRRSGRR